MKKKIATKSIKQEKIASTVTTAMHQLMIPLMIGAEATRKGLFAFVQQEAGAQGAVPPRGGETPAKQPPERLHDEAQRSARLVAAAEREERQHFGTARPPVRRIAREHTLDVGERRFELQSREIFAAVELQQVADQEGLRPGEIEIGHPRIAERVE